MEPNLWEHYQHALAQQLQAQPTSARLCVGCWYQVHTAPFPAAASSSLCPTCARLACQRTQRQEVQR
jgi:hypothetical protein